MRPQTSPRAEAAGRRFLGRGRRAEAARAAADGSAADAADRRGGSRWHTTRSSEAGSSWRAATARPRARCCKASASPTRTWPSRSSAWPTPGSRRCPATSTSATLAARVKEGIRAAGGTPMEFNTIAICDGITMGTEGMKASLVSPRGDRRLDRAGRARPHVRRDRDRLVGCDKTIPARRDGADPARHPRLRALRRLDRAGPVRGPRRDDPWTSSRRSAQRAAGTMSDAELRELEDAACPGAGRLRRAVHRQHDGDGAWSSSAWRRSAPAACRRSTRARTRSPSRPAGWSWTCSGGA